MAPVPLDSGRNEALDALLSVAEESLVSLSVDGRVTFANTAALALFGLSEDELVGKPFSVVGIPELVARVDRVISGARGATGRFTAEVGDRELAGRIVRSRKRGGGMALSLRDVTAVREERDRSQAVLAATADGLVLLSPDDVLTYINPAACKMLSSSPRKLLGKRIAIDEILGLEHVDPATDRKRCYELRGCMAVECPAYSAGELRCWLVNGTLCHPEAKPCNFADKRAECEACDYHAAYAEAFDPLDAEALREIELDGDGGHLVVKVRVSPVVDGAGHYIGRVIALRDVTTEREIDDMKNEFVSTVSHELRTPLTSIKGYVDLILDGDAGDVNEIQREFLAIVKENSDRLVELINDMLDISRIESGRVHLKVEPVSIADSIAGSVDTFRAVLAQTGRSINVRVPDNLPAVAADRDRVGQVLINLISNAIKYSPGGGEVDVSAGRSDGFVSVSVSDHGLGISAEDQKRLFTKFYRVDTAMTREIGGTGLGLSICKTIIELLGGEVAVKSRIGSGSTFTFKLPVAPEEMVRMPSLEAPDVVGGTVLVVDRDPEIADLIETYLVKRGYDVVKAHTADEAFEVALAAHPRAITLDVILKNGDGFDLLHRLKESPETKDIPVVVLSIVCDEGKSCRMGAANYLEKPIDHNRLLGMIDDIVGSVDSPVALVVDDDRNVVSLLSETLRKKGVAVIAAYDGLEAVAALAQRTPDIIVTDLKMPKMDGYDLIQLVKTTPEWAEIPVLVMTAYRIDRSRIDILQLAAHRLRKPFSPELIADEVEALLGTADAEVVV